MSEFVCKVPACSAEIRPGYLMCKAHWGLVPRDLRREVHRTWRRVRDDRRGHNLVRAVQVYRGAVALAVAAAEAGERAALP